MILMEVIYYYDSSNDYLVLFISEISLEVPLTHVLHSNVSHVFSSFFGVSTYCRRLATSECPPRDPLGERCLAGKCLARIPAATMVRSDWTNLNGLWDYSIRLVDGEKPSEWDGKILVPFAVESALSGVGKTVSPDEKLWYRRNFSKPSVPEGDRLLLHFGAVDWQCTLWVNGQLVGEHEGALIRSALTLPMHYATAITRSF